MKTEVSESYSVYPAKDHLGKWCLVKFDPGEVEANPGIDTDALVRQKYLDSLFADSVRFADVQFVNRGEKP